MRIRRLVANAVSNHALELVGVLFGVGALTHFAVWLQTAGRRVREAVAAGDPAAAAAGLASYAGAHPAYVLAFLACVALVARRP